MRATLAEIARVRVTRRQRTSPRRVKRARHHSYKVKRPGDVTIRHPDPPAITLNAIA